MRSNRHPPSYPEKLTIALFGKRIQLKNSIGMMILNSNTAFGTMSNNCAVEENNYFKIINTPDFFDKECPNPDQLNIDFMALSYPGPNLFILAIDPENTQEENVVAQICQLQETFGDKVTAHLVVTLPDIESFRSLSHLKYRFNTQLAIPNENLSSECKTWCSARQSFLYDYKNYSEDVVKRRMAVLKMTRYDDHPVHQYEREGDNPMRPTTSPAFAAPGTAAAFGHHNGNSDCKVSSSTFNIVLLGLAGTGKSASANTILAAGNSQQRFRSESSSLPVTTQCEVKIVEKLFGSEVRLVDTPDFLHDQLKNSEAQVEECKRYCKPEGCVVLLVLQLGRFTDVERGILEKLEGKLGWKIRRSTVVLLTHGEDLKGNLEEFINTQDHLKSIVDLCGKRYHLFRNSSENPKQVEELIKKIPDYKNVFPKFVKKDTCRVC